MCVFWNAALVLGADKAVDEFEVVTFTGETTHRFGDEPSDVVLKLIRLNAVAIFSCDS